MAERDIKQEAKSAAEEAKQTVGEETRQAAEEVREQASGAVVSATESAARMLDDVGRALDDTAKTLEQEDHRLAGHYMHAAARQVRHAADMVHDRHLDDFLAGIERFGRRQPGLFIGGTALLGFALGRFLKSSTTHTGEYIGQHEVPAAYEPPAAPQAGPGLSPETGYPVEREHPPGI